MLNQSVTSFTAESAVSEHTSARVKVSPTLIVIAMT